MLCTNGLQTKPKGSNVDYYICQSDYNKGNSCRYVKWCNKTSTFVMTTDKNGNVCKHYEYNLVRDTSKDVSLI